MGKWNRDPLVCVECDGEYFAWSIANKSKDTAKYCSVACRHEASKATHPATRLNYIIIENGCWEWQGSRTKDGYGLVEDRRDDAGTRYAHIISYEYFREPVPEGFELDHLCRHPWCINPYHLEPVTHKINCLRGVGVGALNAQKTHCPKGHPYEGENLYVIPSTGGRVCRTCTRERDRKRKALAAT